MRDAGFAKVRRDGAKRFYEIDPSGFDELDTWLDQLRRFAEDLIARGVAVAVV